MKKVLLPTFLLLLLCAGRLSAQRYIRRAEAAAAAFHYRTAISLYQSSPRAIQSIPTCRSLATLYTKLRIFDSAAYWYQNLLPLPGATFEDKTGYAETLIACGEYEKAKKQLATIQFRDSSNITLARLSLICDSAAHWLQDSVKGSLQNMDAINTDASEWGFSATDHNVSFCSDRPLASLDASKQTHKRLSADDRYFRLYVQDTAGTHPADISQSSVPAHSASPSYCNAANEMYFASASIIKTKHKSKGVKPSGVYHVEIKHAVRHTDHWVLKDDFPFNSVFQYSLSDPFITDTGDTLFFISDKGKDNFGGTDIYYTTKDRNGHWNGPINIGNDINTIGNERTPYFTCGTLYFASDGRAGLGALDLYKASVDSLGAWRVSRLPAPINSPQDDFSPFVKGDTLYFASNRKGGKGRDDIYSFIPVKDITVSNSTIDSVVVKEPAITPKTCSSQPLQLGNIFFDFNKAIIKQASFKILDSLVVLLNEHPDWKLDIAAHTDIRGTDAYNNQLSEQRANATVAYLIKKGIDRNRLTAKGYGKRMPLLECGSLIKCNERIHLVNRRVEFKIMSN